MHANVKVCAGLTSLRRASTRRVVIDAIRAGAERFGFRVVHYSIQTNHLHFLLEAKDRRALSRGMQGLGIRVAKGLNRLWNRGGRVFADRYHDRILRTPKQVRCVLAYVLNNARRHRLALKWAIDLFGSGLWFDGWRERGVLRGLRESVERPTAAPGTWLLRTGWRRHGFRQRENDRRDPPEQQQQHRAATALSPNRSG